MVEFHLLGPFEVLVNGTAVPINSPKQRVLLASLLLKANFLVRSDELIMHLWEGRPPADGRAALHVHVTRLRRLLGRLQDGQAMAINTVPGGYLLETHPDQLDVGQFQRVSKRATLARHEDDIVAESMLLQQALSLWRGAPLADVPSFALQQDHVPGLVEQRLRMAERWFDLELRLGHHADVIGALQMLSAEHPLRERLWGQLMTAYYRCERQAEALHAYQAITRLLNEELGIDPGEQLARLHQAILTSDPALAAAGEAGKRDSRTHIGPAATPAPEAEPAATHPGEWVTQCQLPSDANDFVGRTESIAGMLGLLTPRQQPGAVPVVRLSGSPGAGKTMLAVRVAHRLRPAYPDGQWYVRLNGASERPRDPSDVLAELLSASGMNVAAVPEGLDARAAVFRARLADRRVLLLLDDAGDAEQVIPLLPGTPGSGVVVTSRSQLPDLVALSGARPIAVDVLPLEEAVSVLARVLGAERVRAEPDAVREVAQLCACLPLALRIAAANLAGRPSRTITEYVAELRRGNLLGKLTVGYESRTAVRAAFDLSYRTLPAALQRLFRLLGLAPGPELSVSLAAQLADIDEDTAEQQLDGLADAHLVEPLTAGRFRFHDLLRLYAAERAQVEDTSQDRRESLHRLYDWYLHTANAAQQTSCPWFTRIPLPEPMRPDRTAVFDDPPEALAWLKAERSNLVAMIVHAAAGELRKYSWRLADILVGYFSLDRHYDDWLTTARAGLEAASVQGDAYATGVTQLNMGLVTAHFLADSTSAVSHLRTALQHFQSIEAWDLQGLTLNAIAMLHLHKNHGQLDDAVPLLDSALAIARQQDIKRVELESLRNLGVLHHARGDLPAAADHLSRAIEVCQEIDLPHVAPDLLARYGLVQCELGRPDTARANLQRSLTTSIELKVVHLQAVAEFGLAKLDARQCRTEDALMHAQRCLQLAVTTQFQAVEVSCLAVVADLEHRTGNHGAATNRFEACLELARQIGHEQVEIEAMVGLARLCSHGHRTALSQAQEAVSMARRSGFRLLEGRALAVLADMYGKRGDTDLAREHTREAKRLSAETGCDLLRWEGCEPAGGRLDDIRT
jgi:DNA-binding SARP family transcriptional activator/tetratricopeptide (TPR) repeat protein